MLGPLCTMTMCGVRSFPGRHQTKRFSDVLPRTSRSSDAEVSDWPWTLSWSQPWQDRAGPGASVHQRISLATMAQDIRTGVFLDSLRQATRNGTQSTTLQLGILDPTHTQRYTARASTYYTSITYTQAIKNGHPPRRHVPGKRRPLRAPNPTHA